MFGSLFRNGIPPVDKRLRSQAAVLAVRRWRTSHVIVDLRLLGVDIRPIYDLTGDEPFAEVFFDNVELGSDSLIGEEGRGWQQVGAELAYERSRPECI